ncbi:MAG: glycoside hydrolase family 32 protein [Brevinema sp.]
MKPQYHFTAEKNWINDPNGLCFHNGKYHMFYQYNPKGTTWGYMHWGHTSSDNLMDWQHLPVALFPDNEYDKDGCFSGSALSIEDELHIMYTGIRYREKEVNAYGVEVAAGDDGLLPSQIHAVSKDNGLSFTKSLPPAIPIDEHSHFAHVRDPKVWKTVEGFYRTVLGNTENRKQGSLLFYKSYNLHTWEYEGKWTHPDFGWGWECPDLFTLDGYDVLIFSPMGINIHHINQVSMYLVGRMNWETFNFEIFHKSFLNNCFDIYAPQTFSHNNRRIMIGWLRQYHPFTEESYTGMMTLPLCLSVKNNILYSYPISEVDQKRGEIFHQQSNKDITLSIEKLCDIELVIKGNTKINLGGILITFDAHQGQLIVDRTQVYFEHTENHHIFPMDGLPPECTLRIFIDHCVVEFFAEKGQESCICIVDPNKFSSKLEIKGNIDLTIYKIQ